MNTLSILGIWHEWLYRTKQSPSRRNYMRALAARPDVTFHLTGPGFPDWDERLTAIQNVDRIMPSCHAVYGYKLAGTERGVIREINQLHQKCVVAEAWNECWPGTTAGCRSAMHPGGGTAAEECRKAHVSLVIIHHENDRHRMQSVEGYGAQLVHIPHCADPVFAESALPWSERRGVVLTGVLNEQHYPLRQRWRTLIDSGRIKGVYFKRPGNYTSSVEESDRLVADYARCLGAARVKLGCSSRWRYALQHQSEAALSGVAHVCDLPDAVPPGYTDMLHAVSPDASDSDLVWAVEYAMENAETIGTRARECAAAGYTTAHYAERLVAAIRECL